MSMYFEGDFDLPDEIRRQDTPDRLTGLPYWWGRGRTRSRSTGSPIYGTRVRHNFGPPVITESVLHSTGAERTTDMTRWAWKNRHNKVLHLSDWDTGGPFDSRKVTVIPHDGTIRRVSAQTGKTTEEYSGAMFAHNDVRHLCRSMRGPTQAELPYPYAGDDVGISGNLLRAYGSTAIARTLPTAPNVSVATTLGELREGLPSLTARALRRGDAGGEFLNLEFGILPLASEIAAYRETAKKSEEILANWRRDSGRRVRRRYTFAPTEPEVVTTTNSGLMYGIDGGHPYAAGVSGTVTLTKTTTRKVWFAGQYRYFVPEVAGIVEKSLQDLGRLYGPAVSPEVLWNLAPFSWLVDWETNIGNVITNASQLGHDGLVLTYGYIMCHSQTTYDYVWKGLVYSGTVQKPYEVRNQVILDRKQRLGASPYGASFTDAELSPKQTAILVALGYSNGRPR